MEISKMERKAIAEQLKAACALRGTPITIKHWQEFGGYIRVLPGKAAQFQPEGQPWPVFRSLSLRIVREEAVALGLTHVRGVVIDPAQYNSPIQEDYFFS